MRYPVNLIPGLPVTPDVGIGITLTPVAPPAPASSPAAAGAAGSAGVFWAFHPFTGAGDDVLAIERGGVGGEVDNGSAVSVPAAAFVNEFGYADGVMAMVVAVVRDVADGAVIAWDIPLPSVAAGVSPLVSDNGGGSYDIYLDSQFHYAIRPNGRMVSCYFTYPKSYGGGYAAWALDPVLLTPSVDGEPLRTLTLNVSALAFGGF